jgi:hypothetical protein
MSATNALKYGVAGALVDMFAPGLSRGLGGIGGALFGLFKPDAQAMDRAYAPEQIGQQRIQPQGSSFDFPKIATIAMGAMTILPMIGEGLFRLSCFTNPMYLPSIWSTPFSPAGLLPMAWNQGLIPNWGMGAGFLY